MSTRDVFSEQELARLRGFPEITSEELIRFFTFDAVLRGIWTASSA